MNKSQIQKTKIIVYRFLIIFLLTFPAGYFMIFDNSHQLWLEVFLYVAVAISLPLAILFYKYTIKSKKY